MDLSPEAIVAALTGAPVRPVTRTKPPWCADCRHRGTAAFHDLSEIDRATMARLKRAHAIAGSGETLVHQGQPLACPMVLYSGIAAKYRSLPNDGRQLLTVLLPGDMVGADIEPGGTSWFSVRTLTDVSLCLFDAPHWLQLFEVPSLAGRLHRRLAADKRHIEERFAMVAACDPKRALAHLVIDLHQRLRARGLARANVFRLPLDRKQLSDAVGVSTVHLHRVLRSLNEDGAIAFSGRQVTIHDADRLCDYAGLRRRRAEPRPLI